MGHLAKYCWKKETQKKDENKSEWKESRRCSYVKRKVIFSATVKAKEKRHWIGYGNDDCPGSDDSSRKKKTL